MMRFSPRCGSWQIIVAGVAAEGGNQVRPQSRNASILEGVAADLYSPQVDLELAFLHRIVQATTCLKCRCWQYGALPTDAPFVASN